MAKKTSNSNKSDCGCGEFRSTADVRTGFFQGAVTPERPIQYAVVEGEAIFEGDIILGTEQEMESHADDVRAGTAVPADAGGLVQGVVITGQGFRWPNATIPFTIDPALPNQQRVTDAIAHWQANTPIRFVPRTAAHVNFLTFRPGSGCSSHVGMRGGQQFINLAAGCSTGSTIHEIGHAVGLWHEQSREDRDRFVRIQWQNITSGMEHNFNQHITDGDDIGAYDFDSIMHYPPKAFSKNGQDTIVVLGGQPIGQRSGLSPGDIATVRAIYPPTKHVIKDLKDRKERKDNKDRKDVKERKDGKERKDVKDTKDVKERKDNKDRKDVPDKFNVKDAKDNKDRKDRKDVAEIPFPRPPFPRPPFDATESAPDESLAARIAELEQTVAQMGHFIEPSQRPDLSTSALSGESDEATAELTAIEEELRKLTEEAGGETGH